MSRALLDAADVARVVDRIAHQLLEKTGGARDTVVLGIPTRGAPLARRLAARVRAFEGVEVPVGTLDITLHRDDLRLRGVRALEPTEEPPGGVEGKLVVLVDDVLYSGRTVRAALDALRDLGRPRAVQRETLLRADRAQPGAEGPGVVAGHSVALHLRCDTEYWHPTGPPRFPTTERDRMLSTTPGSRR